MIFQNANSSQIKVRSYYQALIVFDDSKSVFAVLRRILLFHRLYFRLPLSFYPVTYGVLLTFYSTFSCDFVRIDFRITYQTT